MHCLFTCVNLLLLVLVLAHSSSSANAKINHPSRLLVGSGSNGNIVLAKATTYAYGCVIDMGSKGSRISIYQWPSDAKVPYTEMTFAGTSKSPWYYKIVPGIASLADPHSAGIYLKPLFDYAETKIPLASQPTTPMFVKGTDRLRQLSAGNATIILKSINSYVQENYQFLVKPGFVDLLPGIMEAGLLWVSINFLQKNFDSGKNSDCTGTLDMGSGSTQMAFIPEKGTTMPSKYTFEFGYLSKIYTVYTHSFGGYGFLATLAATTMAVVPREEKAVNGVRVKTAQNPCYLTGYTATATIDSTEVQIIGTGSWSGCYEILYQYLNKSAPCVDPRCSFNGAYQPAIRGDFVAVSNYYDVVDFLELAPDSTGADIQHAGIAFCSLSWTQAQAKYPDTDLPDLAAFCFGANYISRLIIDGYEFGSQNIDFAKTEGGYPITWATGEMVWELQKGW